MTDENTIQREFSNAPPSAKRQKTLVACKECKDRKKKCDGVKPVCGACSTKNNGRDCVYSSERFRRLEDLEYIQLLENRIKELESKKDFDIRHQTVAALGFSQSVANAHEVHQHSHLDYSNKGDLPPSLNSFTPLLSQNLSGTNEQRKKQHLDIMHQGQICSENLHLPACLQSQISTTSPSFRATNEESTLDQSSNGNDALINGFEQCEDEDDDDDDERNDDGIDAMGTVDESVNTMSLTTTLSKQNQYYGPSSTSNLMRQIQEAVHSRGVRRSGTSVRRKTASQNSSYQTFPLGKHSRFNLVKVAIPPRGLADALVHSYWNHLHHLYPFLQKIAFEQQYGELWRTDKTTRDRDREFCSHWSHDMFNCILNLVFALGCQVCPTFDSSKRIEAGNTFYQRSKSFIDFESLDNGGVELVQALLLTGQYLQSTGKSRACWNVVGLAIRAAQGIGLHQNQHISQAEHFDQLEDETRKRLWGGCLLFDRVTSMMFGRPPMISLTLSRQIRLPAAIDDAIMTSAPEPPACQPPGLPSTSEFFVEAVKLLEIVGEVLDAFYGGSAWFNMSSSEPGNPSQQLEGMITGNYQQVLRLDNALTVWQDELPSFLKWKSGTSSGLYCSNIDQAVENPSLPDTFGDNSALFLRQSSVLQARYLHVKILLFRPLLSVAFSQAHRPIATSTFPEPVTQVLNTSMMHQFSACGVAAAQNLFEIVQKDITSSGGGLPAWWYNIFYLYTCATVVLAGRLCPTIERLLGKDSLRECWDGCLRCLEEYKSQSRFAGRCFKILQLIDVRIFQSTCVVNFIPNMDECAQPTNSRATKMPASATVPQEIGGMMVNSYLHVENDRSLDIDMPLGFFDDIDDSANGFTWHREIQSSTWSNNFPFNIGVDILTDELYN